MAKKKVLHYDVTAQPLFDLVQEESPQSHLVREESFTSPWRELKALHHHAHLSMANASLDLLAGLNGPQREAVTTTKGPLLIFAGSGSGKTRVITHRIAHLLLNEQVEAKHILAVTFTNRAAREMDDRLERLVREHRTRDLIISTFHSLCYRLLRHASDAYLMRFSLTNSFSIADELDSLRALREVTKQMNLDGLEENQCSAASLQSAISQAKNAMITPCQIEKQAEKQNKYSLHIIARVYRAYEFFLIRANCLDFDDPLGYTIHLLRTENHVRTPYQERWQYIHVDEW